MDLVIIALLLLGLTLLITLILVFVKLKNKPSGEPKEINYQAFFGMGISFIGLGIVLTVVVSPGFTGITALGVIYMLIGLKNRDKWINPKKEK
jgi:hypothetical protein